MKYQITNTTDGQYVGSTITVDLENKTATCTARGTIYPYESIQQLPNNEIKLINSNYIIEAKEL